MNDKHFLALYLAGTILLVIIAFFVVGYILIYSRRQQKNRLERAMLMNEHERTLFSARLEEQERAMNQISKEVHDNVSQKVDFIQMNLKAMEDADTDELRLKLKNNSFSLLGQVTADLRNISYSLNSDHIRERGLGEVLETELSYIASSRQIRCQMHVDGLYRTLPAEEELLLYRIAQEALHNAAKYSKATEVTIELCYSTDGYTMQIADNGIGFDQNQPDFLQGLGFRNMAQRADLLGAELHIVSSPGSGCSVTVSKHP